MTERDRLPEKFGPYRVLERIGEGGMGVVYLATDSEHRKVAIKALRPSVAGERDARRRLAREVETMRRVHSPNVAEVLDADVNCDPPYIVTQYVHGRTLDQVVSASGPLRGAELARLARGTAAALCAVHAAGVVHRDLKPGNIMLSRGEPVVIDFGIAHSPESSRITQTGMFMGTPGYLAPEVIEGKDGGQASDVHSWGSTLAFAATGRPPFGTGSFEAIFYRIVHGQPDLAGCPPPLFALLAAALSRDPSRRPSAAQLAARLATIDPATLVPGPVSPGVPAAGGPAPQRPGPGGLLPAALAGGAAAPGTMADWAQLPGAGVPTAVPPGVARPYSTQPLSARGPAGRGPAGQNVADLLPDFQYGPPGASPGAGAAPVQPAPAARLGRLRPLFVLATVLAGASVSVLLPVAGTVAALAAIVALRAADLTAGRLRRRRSARGQRSSDTVVTALTYPPMLAWSAVISLALSPVALVAGGIAAAITLLAVHAHPFPQAVAYGAGALVISDGLGPGSEAPRRQLGKIYDGIARSPGAAAVTLIVVCALALAALGTAVSDPAFYWPFTHIGSRLQHLDVLHGSSQSARSVLLRLLRQIVG
jgi:predicted Ser/Thr protein kinase